MRAAAVFVLLAVACGDPDPVPLDPSSTPEDPTVDPTSDTDEPPIEAPACVPSPEAFEANALPVIERACGTCHGDPTDYGAPYSLLDYEALVAGPERPVDAMLAELMAGTMPPASQGLMSHSDRDTLVGWASCGLQHPDFSEGVQASQPIWEAPVDPPADTTVITIDAGEHPVDVDDIDDYQYFTFRNLTEDDVFIRRMDAVIDESRVVHHITLHYLLGYDYLYTWAPGTGAIEFPDGGLRLKRSDVLVMEIHYNNGAGIEDVADSSGIRMWLGPPVGTEWGMASPSVSQIDALPNAVSSATDSCTVTQDFRILAGMPHMHEIGSALEHVVIRADGTEETLIELTGWSFESQYFYVQDFQIHEGDTMRLTCTYDNPGDETVHWGQGTSDEMCFNFMYVTPPSAAFQCFF